MASIHGVLCVKIRHVHHILVHNNEFNMYPWVGKPPRTLYVIHIVVGLPRAGVAFMFTVEHALHLWSHPQK